MEFNEYQEAANRTLYGNEQVLTNCALGLAGETGQVVDLVKAYTFKGKDLDKDIIQGNMQSRMTKDWREKLEYCYLNNWINKESFETFIEG